MFMSCGDALVDLFSQAQGVGSGDSPGEVAFGGHVGGSPLNVALGLARMGNRAGFLCKNSNDFLGQRIKQYLEINKVDTQWLVPTELNSTLAMIKTNDDGSANYAFYTDNTADVSLQVDELPASLPDELSVLSFGSYSTVLEPTCTALLALAAREQSQRVIAYDPNLRAMVEPDMDIWRSSYKRFSAMASIVKASDEDIRTLNGSSASLENFAADAISAGAGLVIVTEGAEGATVYASDGRRTRSAPIKVKVIDTVGAGDTLHSSTLHYLQANGHINGAKLDSASVDIEALVRFAATAAAITCSRRGADLPTLSEVEAALSA